VRRSQTRRHEVMSATTTGRDQTIHLPPALVDMLGAHADALPPGRMRDSELLFPTQRGGHRSGSCLTRPFLTVAKAIGMTYPVSPRAMRRTFQDLAREAGVRDVVTARSAATPPSRCSAATPPSAATRSPTAWPA